LALSCDAPLIRQGAAPGAAWSFAFGRHRQKPMHWCGTESERDNEFGVFPSEYHAVIRSSLDAYLIHFTDTYVERVIEQEELRAQSRFQTHCRGTIPRPAPAIAESLERLADGLLSACCYGDSQTTAHEIASTLLGLLIAGDGTRPKPTARRRAYTRAREYMHAYAHEELSIRDITRNTVMSARTLAYAFNEHAGLSPMRYLKVYRLNNLRDDLRRSPRDARVSSIANVWGFWHMGKLAVDYRALFGVTPSTDLGACTSTPAKVPT